MHYVCSACGGVSHKPKQCETEGCSMKGHDLTACACENPEHLAKVKQSEEAEKQSTEAGGPVQNPTS